MPVLFAEFTDSLSIPDDALVYRRVDWDKIGGRSRVAVGEKARINGNCFSDYPEAKAAEFGYPGPCMSVGVSTVMIELGVEPEEMLQGFDHYGLTETRVSDLRQLAKGNGDLCPQGIMLSPTKREPWHCVVFDVTERPRKNGCRNAIAKVSAWRVPLVG